MKKYLTIISLLICGTVFAYDKTDATNDFYDNQPIYKLQTSEIKIYGEIENPGITVDFSKLPKRSVLAKETVFNGEKEKFVGTYRYIGYSLCDILNNVKIKRSTGDFKSPVDLYVVIENKNGETAVISWGEIYYPNARYQKIIAVELTPILPHVGDIKWPIPKDMKLVVGTDLITERNISNPIKITIKQIDMSNFTGEQFKKSISPQIAIKNKKEDIAIIKNYPERFKECSYPSIFYGRGRGIHGIDLFTGIPLNYVLEQYFALNKENIMNGLLSVIAIDGYRCAFTFSEIFNINNQADVLFLNSLDNPKEGKFKLFPANDFFSDRAIKCISDIRFTNEM